MHVDDAMTEEVETAIEISPQQFERLCTLVHQHCGINLHTGKQELVRARIAKRVRNGKFRSASTYLESVLQDPEGDEFANLVDALSTNLTSFFRENAHFEYLAKVHLPELIARAGKTNQHRLRCWSAGCSTGEEPYTILMTLAETLPAKPSWDVRLLATDISRPVLRTAAAGRYHVSRLKGVPQAIAERYFVPDRTDPSHVTVSPDLRARAVFNYLNLMESWPFRGPMDFIFCRNVMIYFDKPTQERLVNRYFDILAPGGLLFTGHSESLTGITHRFKYVQPTIYRKP